MTSGPPPRTVVEGARLLADGRFHAAHAAFERAWRSAEGRERRLWQALVQLAAAAHHAERGRLRPAVALLRRARVHLAGLPATAAGIDVEGVRRSVDRTERRLAEGGADLRRWRSGWSPSVPLAVGEPSSSEG